MTNTKNKIILLFCLFVATVSVYAIPSEAEYKKITKAWTLNADGSQVYRFNMELTLFTHTAMNSTYGESFIVFNPEFQELEIHASYTKQVDGTIIKTPENAFVEVLPRFASDAPAYNHLKEMVVVHTGLELGATIYLDYSIVTKAGYYPALDINEALQETSPVKVYTVSVSVPENVHLLKELYASTAKSIENKTNSCKTYQWTLQNIPASSREPFLPQNGNGIPRLIASTCKTPVDGLITLNKKLNEGIQLEAQGNAVYITEKVNTDKEKADIIRNHIVKNMGTSLVPLEHTGYRVRPVDDVLRSAYGTVAEKTQLLAVMLNAIDIPSEVIAVYPANFNQHVCGLKTIKNLLVKAKIGGKEEFISAISMNSPAIIHRGDLDVAYTLNGKRIEIETLPLNVKEDKEITIKADQAVNGYVVSTLPIPSKGIDTWYMSTLNTNRSKLFEIPSLLNEEVVYRVTYEEGMVLETPSDTKTINKSFGSYSQTISMLGNTIEVKRTLLLNKLQYSPAEYKELRMLINEWMNPTNRVLLFSMKR